MFSSVESCRTNRPNSRLVASSIIAMKYNSLPASFQPVMIAGVPLHHLPKPAPPRPPCGPPHLLLPSPATAWPRIIHFRTVSLLASISCFFPNTPPPTSDRIPVHRCRQDLHCLARSSLRSSVRRPSPQPVDYGFVPTLLQPVQQSSHLPYAQPQFLGGLRCVISFFFAFFNATSRSLSACVISSCPSCILQAWGCQEDISTLLKGDIITLPPQSR